MLEATRQASLYIVPVLLTAFALLRASRTFLAFNGVSLRLVLLLIAVPLTLVKIGSLSIASFVLALSAGYSVASMGIMAVMVVGELRRRPVMRPLDWFVVLAFNIVLGGYLYLSVLGVASFDAYPLGYSFSWIFVTTALFTVMLILMKNPMAITYVLAIAAWDLRLLGHSRNFFDYLVDGPLFVVSILGILVLAIRTARKKGTF